MRRVSLLLALLASGCVSRVGDFSMIANRNINVPMKVVQKDVRGHDCKTAWTQGMFPSVEAAIEDAQRNAGGGDALANVSVEHEFQWLVIVNRYCFHVRGDVVQMDTPQDAASR